jgi:hypothetical protein
VKKVLSARERAEYARSVIHMPPVPAVDDSFPEGCGEGELGLPDPESEGYASRKGHDREREGRPGYWVTRICCKPYTDLSAVRQRDHDLAARESDRR